MTVDSTALTGGTVYVATTIPGSATKNEEQTITLGAATGGTVTITFEGQTTAAIAYNASAGAVRLALEALSNVAPGDVAVAPVGLTRSSGSQAYIGGAEIGQYPANPASQSGLSVACLFDNQTSAATSDVSAKWTIHDFPVAQYHNGAARTVTSSATSATDITLSAGTCGNIAGFVNHPITQVDATTKAPIFGNLAARTFIASIAGCVLTLNQPPTVVPAAVSTFKIDNTIGRSSVGVATTSGTDTLTTAAVGTLGALNFSAADVGLSVSGTFIDQPGVVFCTIAAAPAPTATTATVTPAGCVTTTGAAQTITIGGSLLNSTTRTINDATYTTTTSITTGASGIFTADDVGLPVTSPDGAIAAGSVITAVTPTVATIGCENSGVCVPADRITVTAGATKIVTIGDPSVTAPYNSETATLPTGIAQYKGDTAANLGTQLNLDPGFVVGSDACANEVVEGFETVASWNNPGVPGGSPLSGWLGLGLPNLQPVGTKAIAQLAFKTSVTTFSGFVIERTATAEVVTPNAIRHYDVVFPFVPTGLATCASSATSPGIGFALHVHGQTLSQGALPGGAGKPGSAQQRSILPSATGGYVSTAYVRSNDPAHPWPPIDVGAFAFERLCVWTAGAGPLFQCGNG